jgi:peptidoglycan/LPS O-acetylase OafA/YrhL
MINLQSRAWRSTIAAALLFIEGLVVLSLALYLIVQSYIADNVDDRHALLGEIIYVSAGAAILLLISWGFYTNKRFARGPATLFNLIFLGMAYYMFSEGRILLGAITTLIAGSALVAAVSVIPEENK